MNCEYMLAQQLPAAVYVSTDELDDLQRMEMLNAVYPKFIDIEIITEKAKPFTVLLRGNPKITASQSLPIHFRYHAASKKRTKATVEISTPKLYISCPIGNNELIDSELLVTEKHFCLDKQKSDFVEHLNAIKSADCLWQQANVDYQAQLPLRAEIPVGDANDYTLVLYTTVALSWAAAIWTVLRIHSASRRINNELSKKDL
ncbi:uncharacterized protein LOC116805045 isoform X2 [Drosophila grimshawi]|nr:uncharacterized protein LOC116805045 isoform X2 [Drosophila grimshawi]XP_032590709.1 uncharacterized protein LOC116805045 isoform X2 [Drosophila grimshawi]